MHLVVRSWCHKKLERGSASLKRDMYDNVLRRDIITRDKIDELEKFDLI